MMNKIFITSGGTGGHIIPARCLAKHLVEAGYNVHFFGDKKYRNYIKKEDSFTSKIICSSQIKKSPIFLIKAAFLIGFGIIQSLFYFVIKRPKYLFAFGGYATFPLLVVAVLSRTKIILHEQNSHLGKVNRIFARYAYKIATSFDKTSGISDSEKNKVVFVGNPVREEIIKLHDEKYSLPDFTEPEIRKDNKMGYDILLTSDFYEEDDNQELFKILVIGGSGGAKIFSEILPKSFFNLNDDLKHKIQVIQQCRPDLLDKTFEQYKSYSINVIVDSFFEDMPKLLKEAHLVIARSGSSSVFEFCAAKKPMILIPFAAAADNHQEKNARYFEKNKAAIVILESEFNINKVNELLKDLINSSAKLKNMSQSAASLAVLDATTKLTSLINE